jgi:hypothetical protein
VLVHRHLFGLKHTVRFFFFGFPNSPELARVGAGVGTVERQRTLLLVWSPIQLSTHRGPDLALLPLIPSAATWLLLVKEKNAFGRRLIQSPGLRPGRCFDSLQYWKRLASLV